MDKNDVLREMYCSSILIVDALEEQTEHLEMLRNLRREATLSLLADSSLGTVTEEAMLNFCSDLLYLLSRKSEFSMLNTKSVAKPRYYKLLNEEVDCIFNQFN
ncbi:hypothetical protein [Shewanella marisflavi]|uniref:hypothetical protein n=1 Tax=Shewanella marisflavi TaxID=260364 RepID=UPI003AAD8D53